MIWNILMQNNDMDDDYNKKDCKMNDRMWLGQAGNWVLRWLRTFQCPWVPLSFKTSCSSEAATKLVIPEVVLIYSIHTDSSYSREWQRGKCRLNVSMPSNILWIWLVKAPDIPSSVNITQCIMSYHTFLLLRAQCDANKKRQTTGVQKCSIFQKS